MVKKIQFLIYPITPCEECEPLVKGLYKCQRNIEKEIIFNCLITMSFLFEFFK